MRVGGTPINPIRFYLVPFWIVGRKAVMGRGLGREPGTRNQLELGPVEAG